jgi:hypothetical protein
MGFSVLLTLFLFLLLFLFFNFYHFYIYSYVCTFFGPTPLSCRHLCRTYSALLFSKFVEEKT